MVNFPIFNIRGILVVLLMIVSSVSYGDNYRILQLNSEYVSIGDRALRKGDTFSDKDIILWNNDRQAIKCLNLNNKKTLLLVAGQLKKSKSKTLLDYVVYSNRLSVRDDACDYNNSEQYMLDELRIVLPGSVSDDGTFILKYMKSGKVFRKTVVCDKEGDIIIPRGLFTDVKQDSVSVDILYQSKDDESSQCLINNMRIVLL